MNFFLYNSESAPTAREMIKALKEHGANINGGTEPPREKIDILIRWGSQKQIAVKPNKVYNKLSAIRQTSDKLTALKVLDSNGVRVPPFSTIDGNNNYFPALGRKIKHTGGEDIILLLQQSDLKKAKEAGCSFLTEYIPTKNEYRVHVFGDKAVKVSQKILTEPDKATNPWVRNLDTGYTFREPRTKLSKIDEMLAINAVQALGLDFGAVDLVVSDKNIAYILEVNTAPGLLESSVNTYVPEFIKCLAEGS